MHNVILTLVRGLRSNYRKGREEKGGKEEGREEKKGGKGERGSH